MSSTPQGWRAVAALFLTVSIVESLAMGHLFSFLPLLLREMEVGEADLPARTARLSSLMFVLGLPLVPFWGVLADRYSRSAVIARSAYVEAVVFAVLALAATPAQLGAGMLLVGLQLGNTGVMLAALRQVTPPERVGFALSLVQLGSPIGTAVGPALGGWLMDHTPITLRGLFVIDAVLSVAAGLLVTFGYRETRPASVAQGSIWRVAFGAVGAVFALPVARTLFGLLTAFLVGRGMINPLLALVVQRVHSGTVGTPHTPGTVGTPQTPGTAGLPSAIGLVAGTAATLGALAAPLAGLAGDRLGHRAVLGAGALAGAAALAGMRYATSVGELAALSALLGAAGATVVSMVYALLALRLPEEHRSSVLSLAFVPFYVGGILGPNLAARLAGNGLEPIFPVAAGCALCAAAMAMSSKLSHERSKIK